MRSRKKLINKQTRCHQCGTLFSKAENGSIKIISDLLINKNKCFNVVFCSVDCAIGYLKNKTEAKQ